MGFLILLVSSTAAETPVGCAGCPLQVSMTELSSAQQGVLDWAVDQLNGEGGPCGRNLVRVEKYTSQGVAGVLHTFALELEPLTTNPETQCPGSGKEKCSL